LCSALNSKETPVEELVQYRLKPSLKSGKLVQIPIPIDPDHLRTASATKGDGPAVVTYTQVELPSIYYVFLDS
jgi:hypothetical protein